MIEGALQPGDRVLFLSIPDPATVRRVAARLPRGILVGIGTPEEVADARLAATDLDNVMFHAATPAEIPWQDGFFSVIVDSSGAPPASEVTRVLALGGRIESQAPWRPT